MDSELGISIDVPAEHSASAKKRSRSRLRSKQYARTDDFDAEGIEKQLETLRTNISANCLLSERGGAAPLVDVAQSFSEQQSTALPTYAQEGSLGLKSPQLGVKAMTSYRPQYATSFISDG